MSSSCCPVVASATIDGVDYKICFTGGATQTFSVSQFGTKSS